MNLSDPHAVFNAFCSGALTGNHGENHSGDRTGNLAGAWLSLCVGNTHAHWTYLEGDRPLAAWDLSHITDRNLDTTIDEYLAPHLAAARRNSQDSMSRTTVSALTDEPFRNLPIAIASVVPAQTELWRIWLDREHRTHRILTLGDIPLAGLYPTLGIDRALAGLGIGTRFGFPCLTIDGGTAMTMTGFAAADTSEPDPVCRGTLVGGAIAPGIGLQYRSLGQHTAQLPDLLPAVQAERPTERGDISDMELPETTPQQDRDSRWACDTASAIDSGIQRAIGALAWDFIADWWQRYPSSLVAIAGGDALAIRAAIVRHLQEREGRSLTVTESERLRVIPNAIVWGTIATLQAISARSLVQPAMPTGTPDDAKERA